MVPGASSSAANEILLRNRFCLSQHALHFPHGSEGWRNRLFRSEDRSVRPGVAGAEIRKLGDQPAFAADDL